MEGNNVFISDTEQLIMQQVLSAISGMLFEDEKYKDFL